MADIHRERTVKEESLNAGGERIRLAEFLQFADEFNLGAFGFREFTGPGFDKQHRFSVHAGQRGADLLEQLDSNGVAQVGTEATPYEGGTMVATRKAMQRSTVDWNSRSR